MQATLRVITDLNEGADATNSRYAVHTDDDDGQHSSAVYCLIICPLIALCINIHVAQVRLQLEILCAQCACVCKSCTVQWTRHYRATWDRINFAQLSGWPIIINCNFQAVNKRT